MASKKYRSTCNQTKCSSSAATRWSKLLLFRHKRRPTFRTMLNRLMWKSLRYAGHVHRSKHLCGSHELVKTSGTSKCQRFYRWSSFLNLQRLAAFSKTDRLRGWQRDRLVSQKEPVHVVETRQKIIKKHTKFLPKSLLAWDFWKSRISFEVKQRHAECAENCEVSGGKLLTAQIQPLSWNSGILGKHGCWLGAKGCFRYEQHLIHICALLVISNIQKNVPG